MSQTTMNSIDQQKQLQRKEAKQRRALAYQGQTNAGLKACDIWCSQVDLPPNQIISIYWPLGDELDPLPLLTQLHALGHKMVLPVMLGAGKPLVFKRWQPGDQLQDAGFGTKEPLDDQQQLDPDVILAPLLAYDQQGYRLGYGGGFYDRTLDQLRQHKKVQVFGLAFAEQEVDLVVRGEYDQALDGMVTPKALTRF
jgi:5-formyltetrahydrofolate cyclo-ligase